MEGVTMTGSKGIDIISVVVPLIGFITALVSLVRVLLDRRTQPSSATLISAVKFSHTPEIRAEWTHRDQARSELMRGIYFIVSSIFNIVGMSWVLFSERSILFASGALMAPALMIINLLYVPLSIYYGVIFLRSYRILSVSPPGGLTVAHRTGELTVKANFYQAFGASINALKKINAHIVELDAGDGHIRAVKHYHGNKSPFVDLSVKIVKDENDNYLIRIVSDGVRPTFTSDSKRNGRNVTRFIEGMIG